MYFKPFEFTDSIWQWSSQKSIESTAKCISSVTTRLVKLNLLLLLRNFLLHFCIMLHCIFCWNFAFFLLHFWSSRDLCCMLADMLATGSFATGFCCIWCIFLLADFLFCIFCYIFGLGQISLAAECYSFGLAFFKMLGNE